MINLLLISLPDKMRIMSERYETRESVILESKGLKLFGILHLPVGVEKPPVVLICHGLAGHKMGKQRLYVSLATLLTQVGIAAFRIDFRGSGDSEGEFHEMTVTSCLEDTHIALDYLQSLDKIDSERIGIYGRSFGGSVAVMAASKFSHIKSVALWAPVFNADPWRELWAAVQSGKLDDEQKEKVMTINGQVPSMEFYAEFFNIDLVDDLDQLKDIPVLHIHGIKDELIQIEHADQYMRHRESASGKTKFVRLPEADHDFSIAEDQQTALNLTCDWFQETLLTRGERWRLFWKNFEWLTIPDFLRFWDRSKTSS